MTRYLTSAELAERLNVPEKWPLSAARAGKIPSYKVGKYRRFIAEEVEAALRAQREGER